MVGISHFQQHDEWILGERIWKMEISEEVVAVDSQVRLLTKVVALGRWTLPVVHSLTLLSCLQE